MADSMARLSTAARTAVTRGDWQTVTACVDAILERDDASPEGHFLRGLVEKEAGREDEACEAFSRAIRLDPRRYDAAIELAYQYSSKRQNAAAAALVAEYEDKLSNSPLYLNMAGSVYSQVGMPEHAWPLYKRANELQPGVDLFQANLAICSMYLGKIDEATDMFKRLLERFPAHQQNHLTLANLQKATDRSHIDQMKDILRRTKLPPERNIFLYYAIGKELEDLEEWDEAFEFFKKAGDAVMSVADYHIEKDLRLIDTIIEVCNADWVLDETGDASVDPAWKTPIFIVGLPRTGTTLTDRILASHSQVQSAGETQFMQMVLRRESGVESEEKMTPEMIVAAAKLPTQTIGQGYMDMLGYRLGEEPYFVDKLPFNVLYLGFIAKAFPAARIVVMRRSPMDSCFAMYKQVFTWAYKFSYSLEGLGRFFVAYVRLLDHWRQVLGDRLIEIEYEALVSDQEGETRKLLEKLGLGFEDTCLNFHEIDSATMTASSVQVRRKIHSHSVNRWKHYEKQLQPLREYLEGAGIAVE
jgi:Tfp pilus assembly protein PilF